VVSAAALAFLFAIEKFHIWEKRPRHPETDRHAEAVFDHTSEVWLGAPAVAARTKYSLAFILSFALGFALLPGNKIESKGIMDVTVHKARGGDTLFIDGNYDRYGVLFNHVKHIDSLGQRESCVSCHHMNVPLDKESGCWECHRGMYTETDIFDHDWHSNTNGANVSCNTCHTPGEDRQKSTAKKCEDCHIALIPAKSAIQVEDYSAPSYTEAMHGLCIPCHKKKTIEIGDQPNLGICTACHETVQPEYLRPEIREGLAGPYFNRVVIPGEVIDTSAN
jgi:hypothetical protein